LIRFARPVDAFQANPARVAKATKASIAMKFKSTGMVQG
jgi:hypothetical protein